VRESYFWVQFKAAMVGFAHASRIENTAGNGISDVNLCRDGIEVWVELKMMKGSRLHFRNSQLSWILTRAKFGGRVRVLARNEDVALLYDAQKLLTLNQHRAETPQSFSILVPKVDDESLLWRSPKPFKWQELREVLFVTDLKQESILPENS
jgi:hypothetical protein